MRSLIIKLFLSFIVFAALLSGPSLAFANSIADLPQLSKLLVDHFNCQVIMLIEPGNQTTTDKFSIPANVFGHSSIDHTTTLGSDSVASSVNAQALQIEWTRAGKAIATSLTMIQNSSTQSYVLIVQDPQNEDSQVSLGCNAVTFANLAKQAGH